MSLVGHTPVTVCGVSGRAGSAERDRDRARASAQQQRRHDGASQQQQGNQRGSQQRVLPVAADRGREGNGGAYDRPRGGRRGTGQERDNALVRKQPLEALGSYQDEREGG